MAKYHQILFLQFKSSILPQRPNKIALTRLDNFLLILPEHRTIKKLTARINVFTCCLIVRFKVHIDKYWYWFER